MPLDGRADVDFGGADLGRFLPMGARYSRPKGVYGTLAALAAGALAVASCGGDQTRQATICFRDALAKTTVPSTQGPVRDCQGAAAYKIMQRRSGTRFSVTCAHQAGNEYVCEVAGPATQSVFSGASAYMLPGGLYNVTYDGHRISYQPSGG
jgi:hypothetical protein